MRIAFYGSSLTSAYWNGAATYYRGILKALAALGHSITFYEPDAYGRQQHRDLATVPYARVVVWPATPEGCASVIAEAAQADVVVKASGVGVFDEALLAGVIAAARADAVTLFWDVDAPATLADMGEAPDHPVRAALGRLDAVFTYGGGPPVVGRYRELGAALTLPVYNALDPETHHPVAADARFAARLSFLGNRLPDREARVEAFFLEPAARAGGARFLIGGAGWEDKAMPASVERLGHVPTGEHNAFNASPLAVLNIARDSMAATGHSPATRVFEAAGAAACLITDAWEGIERFLEPGREVLVARDGREVSEHLAALTPARARAIGAAARARVLRDHTYGARAALVDEALRSLRAHKTARAVA